MKKIILIAMLASTALAWCQKQAYPSTQQELYNRITTLDNQAFEAYNQCDLVKFRTFFTDDLEFYHDKGGITFTSEKLIESMKTGMCGNPDWKLRREVVPGTLQVYPLEDASKGYGAILTGEHYFYVTGNGKEQRTGIAKFTHLWLLKDGKWKMSRVLSYDHRGAE